MNSRQQLLGLAARGRRALSRGQLDFRVSRVVAALASVYLPVSVAIRLLERRSINSLPPQCVLLAERLEVDAHHGATRRRVADLVIPRSGEDLAASDVERHVS